MEVFNVRPSRLISLQSIKFLSNRNHICLFVACTPCKKGVLKFRTQSGVQSKLLNLRRGTDIELISRNNYGIHEHME